MKTTIYLFVTCLLLSTAGCSSVTAPIADVGDPAPPFTLMEVTTDKPINRDSLKGDDVVLVNFWSTTCVNCMKEIEDLKKIHNAGQAKVVGIVLDGTPEQVKKIVNTKGIEYPVLAGDEEVFTEYDGYSIPYTLVLDSNLTIRKKFFGLMNRDEFEQTMNAIKSET